MIKNIRPCNNNFAIDSDLIKDISKNGQHIVFMKEQRIMLNTSERFWMVMSIKSKKCFMYVKMKIKEKI